MPFTGYWHIDKGVVGVDKSLSDTPWGSYFICCLLAAVNKCSSDHPKGYNRVL